MELEPKLIEGGLAVDDRGELGFVNDFDFSQVRRFYRVTNYQRGFVRAWHAHRKEAKFVMAMVGAAMVAAVRIDNWEKPSKDSKVYRHVLSANRPAILYIPAGYANGFMTLTDNAALVFYSTATLQESRGDDIRYDARYWDPWQVIER